MRNPKEDFFNNPMETPRAPPPPPPPPRPSGVSSFQNRADRAVPPSYYGGSTPRQQHQVYSSNHPRQQQIPGHVPPKSKPFDRMNSHSSHATKELKSTPIMAPFTSHQKQSTAPPISLQQPPQPVSSHQNQSSGSIWFEGGKSSQKPVENNLTNTSSNNPQSSWYTPTNTTNTDNLATAPNAPAPSNNSFSTLSGPMELSTKSFSKSSSDGEYIDEPPLLEELGINMQHIFDKSRAVILPISRKTKENTNLMDEDDLAGPFIIALLLGGELLLAGKIHFSYIYGFSAFACLAMSLIFNLISPPDKPISVWTVISILGYSLLPVNILALANIFIHVNKLNILGIVLASLTIIWCTLSSTRLFEKCGLRNQRYLVAYPTMLVYSAFVILTIF